MTSMHNPPNAPAQSAVPPVRSPALVHRVPPVVMSAGWREMTPAAPPHHANAVPPCTRETNPPPPFSGGGLVQFRVSF